MLRLWAVTVPFFSQLYHTVAVVVLLPLPCQNTVVPAAVQDAVAIVALLPLPVITCRAIIPLPCPVAVVATLLELLPLPIHCGYYRLPLINCCGAVTTCLFCCWALPTRTLPLPTFTLRCDIIAALPCRAIYVPAVDCVGCPDYVDCCPVVVGCARDCSLPAWQVILPVVTVIYRCPGCLVVYYVVTRAWSARCLRSHPWMPLNVRFCIGLLPGDRFPVVDMPYVYRRFHLDSVDCRCVCLLFDNSCTGYADCSY